LDQRDGQRDKSRKYHYFTAVEVVAVAAALTAWIVGIVAVAAKLAGNRAVAASALRPLEALIVVDRAAQDKNIFGGAGGTKS